MPDPRRRWPAGASCRPRVAEALTRRVLLAAMAAPTAGWPASTSMKLAGHRVQGGALIGHTRPGATYALDGEALGQASKKGYFVVGFDRDAPAQAELTVSKGKWRQTEALAIAPGDFDVQRIDGLPPDQVEPQDPLLLARIAAEAERKAKGFASRDEAGEGFRGGFIMPVNATRMSSRFGGQRILNGVPNRPHYGADLAAPVGTPIRAPAPGLISFAETGMHFEGGLVLIDHGQGLITAYLHQSKVVVSAGERVKRGQLIGEVGQEGRATGPHLCWRMKWRGRNLDPTLLVGVVAPAV
jgi:murein DD-endopeptidase MepM/ murein hydrolase activator NlpD